MSRNLGNMFFSGLLKYAIMWAKIDVDDNVGIIRNELSFLWIITKKKDKQ